MPITFGNDKEIVFYQNGKSTYSITTHNNSKEREHNSQIKLNGKIIKTILHSNPFAINMYSIAADIDGDAINEIFIGKYNLYHGSLALNHVLAYKINPNKFSLKKILDKKFAGVTLENVISWVKNKTPPLEGIIFDEPPNGYSKIQMITMCGSFIEGHNDNNLKINGRISIDMKKSLLTLPCIEIKKITIPFSKSNTNVNEYYLAKYKVSSYNKIESFTNKFLKINSAKKLSKLNNNDLLQLYKSFLQKEYELFFEEKKVPLRLTDIIIESFNFNIKNVKTKN